MSKLNTLPTLFFDSEQEFEAWLEVHFEDTDGIWLKMSKKGSGIPSVNYAQALDVALCYGWIDGQKRPFDAQYWLQQFGPRRAKSIWSQVNREKIALLTAAGRMKPSGIVQVEKARADGRWDAAYASQSTATIPPELQAALDADPEAAAFFASMSSVNRYAMIFRITTAKRVETRAAHVQKFITMLKEQKTIH